MSNVANWVMESTSSVGTGPITLSGAPAGQTSFKQAFGTGIVQVYYAIFNGNNREAGVGTFNGTSDTISRDQINATLVGGVYDSSSPSAITLVGDSVVLCTFNSAAFAAFLTLAEGNALYEPRDPGIQSHIADPAPHREINDAGSTVTDLWSASKIGTDLGTKADQSSLDSHTGDGTIHFLESAINHSNIQGVGTLTHVILDQHVADIVKHREIDDSGTADTDLWSAAKIKGELDLKLNVDPTELTGTYLDFNHADWGTLQPGFYYLSGLGSAFSNPPVALTPAANYIFLCYVGNWTGFHSTDLQFTSDTDTTNHNKYFRRSGSSLADANTKGWLEYSAAGGGGDLTDAEFPTYAVFNAVTDNGIAGATETVGFASGNKHLITISGADTTITLAAPAGKPANFILAVVMSSAQTITWANVTWLDAVPAFDAGTTVILAIYYNGTTFYASGGVAQ